MKGFLKSAVAALAIFTLVTISAFAAGKDKVKKDNVTLASDVTVNGKLVKAGTCQVTFDEQTGELAILKDGKTKAKVTVHSTQRSDKARDTVIRTATKGDVAELIGVTFGGSNQDLVVGASSGTNGNQ